MYFHLMNIFYPPVKQLVIIDKLKLHSRLFSRFVFLFSDWKTHDAGFLLCAEALIVVYAAGAIYAAFDASAAQG